MVKIIIVAHGELAQELVNSVEAIVGKQSNLYVVKIEIGGTNEGKSQWSLRRCK